ncbi:MAG: helix-turn-helix domain-containing protein [Eisenbergiella sp.]
MLHIHKNTLVYRLDKIREMLNMNPLVNNMEENYGVFLLLFNSKIDLCKKTNKHRNFGAQADFNTFLVRYNKLMIQRDNKAEDGSHYYKEQGGIFNGKNEKTDGIAGMYSHGSR